MTWWSKPNEKLENGDHPDFVLIAGMVVASVKKTNKKKSSLTHEKTKGITLESY